MRKITLSLFYCHFFRIINATQSHLCGDVCRLGLMFRRKASSRSRVMTRTDIWKAAFMCVWLLFFHTHLQNNRPLFKCYVTHVLLISIKQHRTQTRHVFQCFAAFLSRTNEASVCWEVSTLRPTKISLESLRQTEDIAGCLFFFCNCHWWGIWSLRKVGVI